MAKPSRLSGKGSYRLELFKNEKCPFAHFDDVTKTHWQLQRLQIVPAMPCLLSLRMYGASLVFFFDQVLFFCC